MKKILITLTTILALNAHASLKFFNSSDVQLGVKSEFKCGTNLSCSVVSGKVVANVSSLSADLTLADSEVISNASDVVSITFDDAAANLKLVGFEATDAYLTLQADQSDDNGDDWRLGSAASGNAFTIANDVSGSFVSKLSIAASTGNVSLVGDLAGDGGDQLYGFLQNQVASTTGSLTAGQCGSTIVSDSADVQVLPEASTVLGCRFTFVCGTADDFDIDPADGTDTIGSVASITGTNTTTVLAPSAGDAIRCTDIGSSITLEAVGADLWVSIGASNGIWTDVN